MYWVIPGIPWFAQKTIALSGTPRSGLLCASNLRGVSIQWRHRVRSTRWRLKGTIEAFTREPILDLSMFWHILLQRRVFIDILHGCYTGYSALQRPYEFAVLYSYGRQASFKFYGSHFWLNWIEIWGNRQRCRAAACSLDQLLVGLFLGLWYVFWNTETTFFFVVSRIFLILGLAYTEVFNDPWSWCQGSTASRISHADREVPCFSFRKVLCIWEIWVLSLMFANETQL